MKERGFSATSAVCDISKNDQVEAAVRQFVAELGHIDILVNNAGIPKRRHVTKLDMATVESVMRINYLSPVRLTLALLPGMLEQGAGRVINVSSIAATLSSPGESAYDASKAALTAFSESMAVDLWDRGIRVLVVYPGLVDTEFSLLANDIRHRLAHASIKCGCIDLLALAARHAHAGNRRRRSSVWNCSLET